MEIEYIYPKPSQKKPQDNNDTIGCLILLLSGLIVVFIFLWLLPFLIFIVAWLVIITAIFLIYKMYLEIPLINLINKIRKQR